jgi:hypothetical protein
VFILFYSFLQWRLLLGCMETRLKEHSNEGTDKLVSQAQHNALLAAYKGKFSRNMI